jgi:hypothetical protein
MAWHPLHRARMLPVSGDMECVPVETLLSFFFDSSCMREPRDTTTISCVMDCIPLIVGHGMQTNAHTHTSFF